LLINYFNLELTQTSNGLCQRVANFAFSYVG
jgi:hypothetical protein